MYKGSSLLFFNNIKDVLLCTDYVAEESLRFLITNLASRHVPKGNVSLKSLFGIVREKGTVSVLSFDFDKIPLDQSETFLKNFLDKTGLSIKQIGVVHTGNGIHIYIPVTDELSVEDFSFLQDKYYQIIYKTVADGAGLKPEQRDHKGLKHWSAMGRVPLTHNTKNINGALVTKKVYPLNVPNEPTLTWNQLYSLLLQTKIDIALVIQSRKIQSLTKDQDRFVRENWKETPLIECDVVRYCIEKPNEVKEPLWFDLLRILKDDPHGKTLAHKISERYDDYDKDKTEIKYESAQKYTSPTCGQMDTLYKRCHSCKHYKSKYIYRPAQLLSQEKWSIVLKSQFKKD